MIGGKEWVCWTVPGTWFCMWARISRGMPDVGQKRECDDGRNSLGSMKVKNLERVRESFSLNQILTLCWDMYSIVRVMVHWRQVVGILQPELAGLDQLPLVNLKTRCCVSGMATLLKTLTKCSIEAAKKYSYARIGMALRFLSFLW